MSPTFKVLTLMNRLHAVLGELSIEEAQESVRVICDADHTTNHITIGELYEVLNVAEDAIDKFDRIGPHPEWNELKVRNGRKAIEEIREILEHLHFDELTRHEFAV